MDLSKKAHIKAINYIFHYYQLSILILLNMSYDISSNSKLSILYLANNF
jgi:hypothetical protein